MKLFKLLKEKAIRKGGSIIDRANSYIDILENKIKELLEDRNKLLEENELLIKENKLLKNQILSQKSLEQENQTLKLLLLDLKKELEKEKIKPPRIIVKEVVKELPFTQNIEEVKDQKEDAKIETLSDLKKAIVEIRKDAGIDHYA